MGEPLPIPRTKPHLEGIQGVLFDLDGTLIDTIALILSSFRHATREVLGEALSDEVMLAGVGKPLLVQMKEFDAERAAELLRVYREHNAAHHDEMVREYPGTEDTLAELDRRGIRMAVVTSKGRTMADRGMKRFGLDRFIDIVVTADDVTIHKPDPYPLRFAAELLGVKLPKCVYVGDSPHDMQAAIAGGAISVAALWGAFGTQAVLEPGPDFAIAELKDLLRLLDGDTEGLTLDEWRTGI